MQERGTPEERARMQQQQLSWSLERSATNMRDRRDDEVDVRAEVLVSVRGGDDAFRTHDEARQQLGHSYVIMPSPPLVLSKESHEDGSRSSLEEVQVRWCTLFGFSAGGLFFSLFFGYFCKNITDPRFGSSRSNHTRASAEKEHIQY